MPSNPSRPPDRPQLYIFWTCQDEECAALGGDALTAEEHPMQAPLCPRCQIDTMEPHLELQARVPTTDSTELREALEELAVAVEADHNHFSFARPKCPICAALSAARDLLSRTGEPK